MVGRLGFDPFVPGAARTLVVTLHDDKKRVRAEVVLRGESVLGRRELEASRSECGELGDSVAIAVSMILDPLGTGATAPPAPEPSPAPPPPPASPPPPQPLAPPRSETKDPAATSSRRFEPSLEIAPQATIGRGPDVTLGARVGAFAWSGAWALGLEAMVESTAGFVSTPPERARALFAAGSAVACHRRPWLLGCLVGSLGVARGEIEGLASDRVTVAAWAGARVGVPFCASPRLCVTPAVDVLANVVRTRFHADGADVWTAPPIAVGLGIAVELRP